MATTAMTRSGQSQQYESSWGQSTRVTCGYFPRSISQELDHKWSSRNFIWHPHGRPALQVDSLTPQHHPQDHFSLQYVVSTYPVVSASSGFLLFEHSLKCLWQIRHLDKKLRVPESHIRVPEYNSWTSS